MIQPVQPTGQSNASQDPHERARLFELQWEISLLGSYLAATRQNSHLGAQCSKLKNDIKSGMVGADKIGTELNYLIGKINDKIPKEKGAIPQFNFSDMAMGPAATLKCYAATFEKYVSALKENQLLNTALPANFLQEIANLNQTTPQDGFNKLGFLIERVNKLLPSELHIPNLPRGLLSGGRR